SLARFGLRPAIDFTGGSLLEIEIVAAETPLTTTDVEQVKPADVEVESIQNSGVNQFILRTKEIDNQTKDQVVADLSHELGRIEVLRFETVGPTLGRELLLKTLVAVAIVASIIAIYVWRQFSELKYGMAAILAMLHDSLILLGAFSILGVVYGIEVDVLFVTALLTTLSFSVHDTIVVFDRIRELTRTHRSLPFADLVNIAVLQTLSRSINNSMTIIIMLLSLFLLGGETIRWFALALLIGSVTGTYSSTFIAAPLLLLWDDLKKLRKEGG
ncbi:MAG TPA: protein translocase subunit SecF, partial [Patescibacteria group bacterium]